MSSDPDPLAIPSNSTSIALLSARDSALRVPLDWVTCPGVYLTPACFSQRQYESVRTGKCISNLLTGFRRISIDLYYDASRSLWSLCPVELGDPGEQPPRPSNATTTVLSSQTESNSTTASSSVVTSTAASNAAVRRDGTAALQLSDTSVASGSTASGPSSAAITTSLVTGSSDLGAATPGSNNTVLQVGPYSCSPSSTLDLLLDVIASHLSNTANQLDATTLVMTINVRAAMLPNGSIQTPSPDSLPQGDSLLGSVLTSKFGTTVYTPSELLSQRADLNASGSFFTVFSTSQPDPAYFQVDNINGHDATPDGWPSESFMELQKGQRLVLGFGEIAPQMDGYNFSGDSSVVFPSGYLQSTKNVTTASDGTISNGCLFDPARTTLSEANSSWAVTTIGDGTAVESSGLQAILTEAHNLTQCGITPMLNYTLLNATADENYAPYGAFVRSTIWSWAENEPVNSSTSADLNDYQCAALNSSSGRWQVADCTNAHPGACRIADQQPFGWQISTEATYEHLRCDEGSSFGVPRTGLENAYLLSTWRKYERANEGTGPLLWLNFNDLDVAACWVIGQNPCPYAGRPSNLQRRITVPVVAGVVVFALATLTLLVKCAGNRRNTKRRRRRGDTGGDYEGVPS